MFLKSFEICENGVEEQIQRDLIILHLDNLTEQKTIPQAYAKFLMKNFDMELHKTPQGEEPSEFCE